MQAPHTIAAYRDAFRLLLRFASERRKRRPSEIRIEDLDVSLLEKFLHHLETNRGNQARTRINRLAAIHAFFQYVAICEPALALQCQRVLALPTKRRQRRPVEFLAEEEAAALLAAPNPETWIGRRDRDLLLVAIQTGLRNSEITALRHEDVQLLISVVSERVGRCDARHSGLMSQPSSNNGWLNRAEDQTNQSFQAQVARVSAPMLYSDSLQNTSRAPAELVHHFVLRR